MGKADWSVEQLERDLAASFALLGRMEQGGGLAPGESAALAEGVLRCMNGALLKVSESLEEQALLRRELAALREEFQRLDEGRRELATAQERRISGLEREVRSLRGQDDQDAQPERDAGPQRHGPPEAFLERPLVVRTARGDFLGVNLGTGAPLCMAGFVRLVEQGGGQGRVVCTFWEPRGEDWFLSIGLCREGAADLRSYELTARPVLTPSGNQVAELVALAEDGDPVPAEFLLQMFRQLRESLQE